MKVSKLTDDQCRIIADNRPEWMANNRPGEVPEDIEKLLGGE
jgi:hypothetical protein